MNNFAVDLMLEIPECQVMHMTDTSLLLKYKEFEFQVSQLDDKRFEATFKGLKSFGVSAYDAINQVMENYLNNKLLN